jgi:VWFA-related protein
MRMWNSRWQIEARHLYIAVTGSGVMRGESMRAIGIAVRGAAAALIVMAIVGCVDRRPDDQQSTVSVRQPVEGLCKPPDVAPAELVQKPGYQQFSVSVVNAIGMPVAGLKQSNFIVYQQAQKFPVAYFKDHAPVAIALLVDNSGSMVPKLPIVKQRLSNLVENLNRCDEVMLYAFTARPNLLQPLTTNHEMVTKKMDVFHAYGQTAIYDTTKIALEQLADADYADRRIILITDGMDNISAATQDEVSAIARKEGVPIYAIGIGDPNAPGGMSVATGPFIMGGDAAERVDADSLKALSAAAGGRTFIVPGTTEDVGGNGFMNALSSIADTIARSYAIGVVVPADVDPSTVSVALVNRPDLVVHSHLVTTVR